MLEGVFILKEKEGQRIVPANNSEAVVALYDRRESLLWRTQEKFDDYGNLFFHIKPKYPLLDGEYILNICLGLHQGVCHGTSFWTPIINEDADVKQVEELITDIRETKQYTSRYIQVDKEEYNVGEQIELTINQLVEKTPYLAHFLQFLLDIKIFHLFLK